MVRLAMTTLARKLRRSLTPVLIILALLPQTAPTHGAAAPVRVAIAYPSPSPRVAPLWLAQDLDFFGKYGLRGQSVLVRNNQMLTAGFASGDIDVAYTGGTTVLGGAAAGTELKLLASFVSRGRGFLTVPPDIATGGLIGQTLRRPEYRRDPMDVRHAHPGTTGSGPGARQDTIHHHR